MSKEKTTRTGHLVTLRVFIHTPDKTPDAMIDAAHLIKRVEALKLEDGDHAKLEIVHASSRHCLQFAGSAKT